MFEKNPQGLEQWGALFLVMRHQWPQDLLEGLRRLVQAVRQPGHLVNNLRIRHQGVRHRMDKGQACLAQGFREPLVVADFMAEPDRCPQDGLDRGHVLGRGHHDQFLALRAQHHGQTEPPELETPFR